MRADRQYLRSRLWRIVVDAMRERETYTVENLKIVAGSVMDDALNTTVKFWNTNPTISRYQIGLQLEEFAQTAVA